MGKSRLLFAFPASGQLRHAGGVIQSMAVFLSLPAMRILQIHRKLQFFKHSWRLL